MADPPRLTGLEGSLALVRHGESTWIAEGRFQGQADPPLSELGERQAALVAGRLRDPSASPPLPLPPTPPAGIWTSHLRRAAATADAIARAQGGDTPVHATPDLAELSQGAWEGLTRDEVERAHGPALAAWRSEPARNHAPGGESLADGVARIQRALGPILGALGSGTAPVHGGGHVLGYEGGGATWPWAIVVAHDGILRLLLLTLLDLPLERFGSFPFALSSVSVLEFRAGVPRLRAHNLSEHLAPEREGAL